MAAATADDRTRAGTPRQDGGGGVAGDEQLVLPVGLDPGIADLIGRVNAPDHGVWARRVARIGGCAHPLHLVGHRRVWDTTTGALVNEVTSRDAPGGVLLVACGNRRESHCPACSQVYW